MDKVVVTKSKLTALADAIRSKLGITGTKKLAELTQAVTDFNVGVDVSDANAVDADLLAGATAYSKNGKLTGTIQSIPTRAYQPSTTRQVIAAGQFLAGPQMIERMQLEEKTVTPSSETQEITPSTGKHGLSKVTVSGVTTFKRWSYLTNGSNVTATSITIPNTNGLTSVFSVQIMGDSTPSGYVSSVSVATESERAIVLKPVVTVGTSTVTFGTGYLMSDILSFSITASSITITLVKATASYQFKAGGSYYVHVYGT